MAQAFGILGFLLALLAILFASEIMRRGNQNHEKMKASLFKATLDIKALQSKFDALTRDQIEQKKRQAETLKALAKVTPAPKKAREGERRVPPNYKTG